MREKYAKRSLGERKDVSYPVGQGVVRQTPVTGNERTVAHLGKVVRNGYEP